MDSQNLSKNNYDLHSHVGHAKLCHILGSGNHCMIFSNFQIESRLKQKRTLLERLLLLASHFVLTNRVTTSLKRYLLRVTDPQVHSR